MRPTQISAKMSDGIAAGVFPGGVLLVSRNGKIVFHKAFGAACLTPTPVPLTLHTAFDLASLTKPLATTTAIAFLVDRGEIRLNHSVSRFIPEFKQGEKRGVTLTHLLSHTAGLPAWKPYYQEILRENDRVPGFLGSEGARALGYQLACHEPLIHLPGTSSVYSDIGFILLGMIVEKSTGMRLDEFCNRTVFSECRLFWSGEKKLLSRPVASTEACSWRGGVILGTVHDDNAYAMGGVAGHAGLFGTAKSVHWVVQSWLDATRGEGFIDEKLANRFVQRRKGKDVPVGSTWGLGWDTPSPVGSSAGRFFSRASFGHLGFTGTSIWVDCDKGSVVVLLTNRVHPSRENDQIKQFRPEIHDLVMGV
jgi:CubicO group peptidase (beta-lactamase class C family)